MKRAQEQPVHDPATYDALAAPVAPAAAGTAIEAFLADVRELRVKHRIADVYVVAAVPVEGDPSERAMGFGHCGSSALIPALLGRALHEERSRLLAAFDAAARAAGEKTR